MRGGVRCLGENPGGGRPHRGVETDLPEALVGRALLVLAVPMIAAVTGKTRMFMLAKDVNEALGLLRETATARTPDARQIVADVLKIRGELSR